MAKAFSVASWNCEHWKEGDRRNRDRIKFIASQKADVLALYEVEGKEVWRALMDGLPGYSFFITEGQNTQEILVGVASRVTTFLTQKIEFQSRDTYMRPGAFLTVRVDGSDYSLLFLHVASMTDARGFGLRTDMVDRALEFKDYLDKAARRNANFIFLGDLNAMGLDYVFGKEEPPGRKLLRGRVSAEQELDRLAYVAGKRRMRLLGKTADSTWGKKSGARSNLDHVVASQQLRFKSFGGKEVEVRGWPQLSDEAEQAKWIGRYSDHALLYFEVQKD
ncbi:MAG TPA: endonuclease/exonuclease/phosphatase family protein [Solirubrobacterales bacterium]|nr:endonuclease/exonuclease/phosphatase family protein [Solirubrobacterales bacterium]